VGLDAAVMLEAFEFCVPTRVVFGWGAVSQLADLVAPWGDSVLLVTGCRSAKRTDSIGKVTESLRMHGCRVELLAGVTPNPRCTIVDEGARIARDRAVRVVIGFGGGSTIDVAKGIAVAAMADRPVGEYIWGSRSAPSSKLPLFAIPTTAGTGSEISRAAILTNAQTRRKGGLRGDVCLPTCAVVDPQLTVSMPTAITAETGFDAWCHALETYISRKANPFTEALSLHAMEQIIRFLPSAIRDGSDREARSGLSAASLMMGWNLGVSTTCLPHRLQYPIGAKTDSTHARGLAALHPAWIRQATPAASEKFARVSQILARRYKASGDSAIDCAVLEQSFIEEIGMMTTLRDLGVTAADCEVLAEQVTGDVASDPGPNDLRAILWIYQNSF
jgi:alcohol dehydrogenase class IV